MSQEIRRQAVKRCECNTATEHAKHTDRLSRAEASVVRAAVRENKEEIRAIYLFGKCQDDWDAETVCRVHTAGVQRRRAVGRYLAARGKR